MDEVSAIEMVNPGSIPGRAKPKAKEVGIYSFSAWRSALQAQSETSTLCSRPVGIRVINFSTFGMKLNSWVCNQWTLMY